MRPWNPPCLSTIVMYKNTPALREPCQSCQSSITLLDHLLQV